MKLPHILSLFNIIYSLYDILVVVHLYILVVVHFQVKLGISNKIGN